MPSYNRAQERIQRRELRIQKAEERARMQLPENAAGRQAQLEAEEVMDRSFDETSARALAGWWKTGSGSWMMVGT